MNKPDVFLEEREKYIMTLLEKNKRITIAELCDYYQVSKSTIRKQLNRMEKNGMLIRTYGGAISVDQSVEEPIEQKSVSNVHEKRMIAGVARQYIKNGDIVALGGGSTTLELAKLMHDLNDTIVITDSIIAAAELMHNKNIDVRVCGGIVHGKSGCIIGPQAEAFFHEISVQKIFLGADAISIKTGVTSANQFVTQVEYRMLKCAKEVFILADHTKMNKVSLVKQAKISEIDYLITDNKNSVDIIEQLENAGVDIMIAGNVQN